VSDSREADDLDLDGSWGCVIGPVDMANYGPYPVGGVHNGYGDVLFADMSVRAYLATNLNSQIRHTNYWTYWWAINDAPRNTPNYEGR
jgi:hypothetical protein